METGESYTDKIEKLKYYINNEAEFPVVDIIEDPRWEHRLKSYYHKPIYMKKHHNKKWKNGKKK